MIDFTFIIPHYNIDKNLLARCIESIPNDEGVQIIIVDDHSPNLYDENNKLIGDGIVVGRKNVEIYYRPQNQGPGCARNYGIERAKGKWIVFCDADDFFDTANLKKLMALCLNSNYDIVYYAYQVLQNGEISRYLNGYPEDNTRISVLEENDKDKFIDSFYPWQKIIKREFINAHNLSFEPLYLSEDRLFALNAHFLSTSAGRFSTPIYNYYIHEDSLVTSKPSLNKSVGAVNVAIKVNRLLQSNNKLSKYRDKTSQRYLVSINEYNKRIYWYYIAKEIVLLGWKFAMTDREYVCLCTGHKLNVISQVLDKVRVTMGKCITK